MSVLLVDALESAAQYDEEGIAAIAGTRTIRWAELDAYSSALAVALERRGVAPGDRVAILLDGIDAVVAFWAITRASAVGVALDTVDTNELAAALRETNARALIVDVGLVPSFHHAVARSPNVGTVIVRGRGTDEPAGTAVYVEWDNAISEDDAELTDGRRIDLDDAWIERESADISASTRALSHRVLLARAASVVRGLELSEEDDVAGTAFAETLVACAISGACFRSWPSESATIESRTAARSIFVHGGNEDATPPEGATAVALHRHPACGPIALLAGENTPSRVLPNVDVAIVDEKGAKLPHKVVGEIAVRTSSLVAAAPTVGGYFKTGDSGMLDDSGALYVV